MGYTAEEYPFWSDDDDDVGEPVPMQRELIVEVPEIFAMDALPVEVPQTLCCEPVVVEPEVHPEERQARQEMEARMAWWLD